MHKPIQFKDVCFSLPHKLCFSQFTQSIGYGQRIAIIGQNGCGKSTLLRLMQGLIEPTDGELFLPENMSIGYVPQLIEEFDTLSGGQRFNTRLTHALACYPDILLLDEPTNHLDRHNRQSLIRKLKTFKGTLVIVTHDIELLNEVAETIWHIDRGKINVFVGDYRDYKRELTRRHQAVGDEKAKLSRQKKETHRSLMKEQTRAKNSRLNGEKKIENRKWPTIVSTAKMHRANEVANRKKSDINQTNHDLSEQLASLVCPEVIKPAFTIRAGESGRVLVSITEGSVGYQYPVLTAINLSITSGDRVAIEGDNGSGKSTLVKAILNTKEIIKTGEWQLLNTAAIGYLDQHYSTLDETKTVLEVLQECASDWPYLEIRKHLNAFLFRKNEEINALVATLSGGEKARLSLAQIAAVAPKLLLLDEMTNNLDLETKEHVIQVLKEYPGAMVIISHDTDFLNALGINTHYLLHNGLLKRRMEGQH